MPDKPRDNGIEVEGVSRELLAALPQGAIHCGMSTISLKLSRKLAREHDATDDHEHHDDDDPDRDEDEEDVGPERKIHAG